MNLERCPVFKDEAKSRMREAILIGGVEFGSYLTSEEPFDLEYLCIGDSCSVDIRGPHRLPPSYDMRKDEKGEPILYKHGHWATFHTHPGLGIPKPSINDWVSAAKNYNQGICIGGRDSLTRRPRVRCRLTPTWGPHFGPRNKDYKKLQRRVNQYEWTLKSPDLYGPPLDRSTDEAMERDAISRIVEAENKVEEQGYKAFPVVCDYDLG